MPIVRSSDATILYRRSYIKDGVRDGAPDCQRRLPAETASGEYFRRPAGAGLEIVWKRRNSFACKDLIPIESGGSRNLDVHLGNMAVVNRPALYDSSV
jgi:hypothetical protein